MDFVSNKLDIDMSEDSQEAQFQAYTTRESILQVNNLQPMEYASAVGKCVEVNTDDNLEDMREDITFLRFKSNIKDYLIDKQILKEMMQPM